MICPDCKTLMKQMFFHNSFYCPNECDLKKDSTTGLLLYSAVHDAVNDFYIRDSDYTLPINGKNFWTKCPHDISSDTMRGRYSMGSVLVHELPDSIDSFYKITRQDLGDMKNFFTRVKPVDDNIVILKYIETLPPTI